MRRTCHLTGTEWFLTWLWIPMVSPPEWPSASFLSLSEQKHVCFYLQFFFAKIVFTNFYQLLFHIKWLSYFISLTKWIESNKITAALSGKFHYGTPFSGDKIEDISEILSQYGFSGLGKDVLTSGKTGWLFTFWIEFIYKSKNNFVAFN